MAATKLARIDRPFTGGLKDDPKGMRDAAVLEDALMPLGVACERGGFDVTGQSVASSSCLNVYEEVIEAGVAAGAALAPDLLFAGTSTLSIATSVSRSANLFLSPSWDCDANSQGFRFMQGLFNGETLILPKDGISPVMTFAGNLTRTTSAPGVFGITKGSTITTAVGPFVSTDVGAYIYIGPAHGCRRIVSYIDANSVAVDVPWDFTLTVSGRILPMGVLNLFALVAKSGQATKNGTSTTVTGTSTRWDSAPQGEFLVHEPATTANEVTDYIAPAGIDYGTPLPVVDVTGAATITVGGTLPPDWSGATAINYVVGRHLPARVACVHKSRLYAAGYRPYPGRLFVSPPRWDGRTPKNGEFSYEVNIGQAMMMAYQDVPDPFTTHEINGLLSLPSGNLAVLCSDATFVAYGEYPTLTVQKTSDVGNLCPESCIVAEGGAWMAGPEGVFEFRGQNSPYLISGDIDRTWQQLANNQAAPASSISLGYYNGMVLCTVGTGSTAPTFVWDTRNRVWSGPWSLGGIYSYYYSNQPRASASAFGIDPRTGPSRLLAGRGGTQAYDMSTTVVGHTEDIVETSNPGAFRARTPFDFAGDLSQEREAKYVKVQYQLTGTADPLASVTPGPDGVNVSGNLPPTTGDEIGSELHFPGTDGSGTESTLGTRTNRFDVEIERTAGTVTRFAVHEIEAEVKEYRHRG